VYNYKCTNTAIVLYTYFTLSEKVAQNILTQENQA